jgi:hypothetical protein
MPFKLDRPLYLTEDKKEVVEEGDPRARYVLGVEGSEIPDELAEELGLLKIDKKATRPLVEELGEEEEEPKAKQPVTNKAAAQKANKGK